MTESVAKIVASGGDHSKIRFYFPGILQENDRGSEEVEPAVRFPAGGRMRLRSVSDFLPSEEKTACPERSRTLMCLLHWVSFAVDMAEKKDIITPELKKAGNKLVWLRIERDDYELPVYDKVLETVWEIYRRYQERAHYFRLCS